MSIHLYRHLIIYLIDIYQVLRPFMKILCYTTYYVINNAYFCVVKHKKPQKMRFLIKCFIKGLRMMGDNQLQILNK